MLEILLALVIGYGIGMFQGGIKITVKKPDDEIPEETYKSIGNDDVKEYYDKTGGMNDF